MNNKIHLNKFFINDIVEIIVDYLVIDEKKIKEIFKEEIRDNLIKQSILRKIKRIIGKNRRRYLFYILFNNFNLNNNNLNFN